MSEVPGLTICIIAAEESGDRLGGGLMRALKATAGAVKFIGVAGQEMLAEGMAPLVPMREFAFIGLGMVRQLRAVYRYIDDIADAVVAARPDVLVIIDSPELTHRVAWRVRRRAPAIPIVNYVSPSVWAWRPGRARAMRAYVDHIVALLPFEPEVHQRLGGPACTYVGHPAIEHIGELRPSPDEAARRRSRPPIVLVLLGSRANEVKRLSAVFGAAITEVEARAGPLELVVPTVPHLADAVRTAIAAWAVQPRIVVDPVEKRAAFRTARAALAKSGTVTLELALAGVPMVVAYKVPVFEELIARAMIKVPSVVLANLVIGESVVPEFLQWDCTKRNLAAALVPLVADGPERARQTEAFARLDEIMEIGRTLPSSRAAEIVLRYATRRPDSRTVASAAPASA